MISETEYKELKRRLSAYNIWAEQFKKPNGWIVIPAEAVAACPCPFSNAERSAIEVYEFCAAPPDKYFLYINEAKREATTWTGERLGSVTLGREWRDNFGGTRRSVTVHAINGRTYHGTYFASAGDYARVKLRRSKRQPSAPGPSS